MTYCEKHKCSYTGSNCAYCEVVEEPFVKVGKDYMKDFNFEVKVEPQPPTESWGKIEDLLFSLHIRFCPLIDSKEEVIKQADCNAVKEELKNEINYLLSQAEARHREKIEKDLRAMSASYNELIEQIKARHKAEMEKLIEGIPNITSRLSWPYSSRLKQLRQQLKTKYLKE